MKIQFTLFKLVPLLGLVLLSFNSSFSQCIPSTSRVGTLSANDNTVGSIDFSNLGNVFSSNDARASATGLAVLFSGSTHYLKVTGFGFTIPAIASICGIVVTIEKRDGGFLSIGTGLRDNDVRLVKNNLLTGNNMANAGNWPTSDVVATHGSPSDLSVWGTTLTATDVNSPNFGIAISAKFNGIASLIPSAQIDEVRMTVYFNPALPTHLVSFTGGLQGNKTQLNWTTAGEEDNEFITVQRSATGESDWKDLARFDMHGSNNGKEYTYTDHLQEPGNYSYRLRITNSNAMEVYSSIKNILFKKRTTLAIYPNPAADYIIVDHTNSTKTPVVTNLYMQRLQLSSQSVGNTSTRFNLQGLPPGIYLVTAGDETTRFVKK